MVICRLPEAALNIQALLEGSGNVPTCGCWLQVFYVSVFGSRPRAVGTVTCSKKLILSSSGKGAKGNGDSLLCFVRSNGSVLRLGRGRVTGDVGQLYWEEGSGLIPCLRLLVGTG